MLPPTPQPEEGEDPEAPVHLPHGGKSTGSTEYKKHTNYTKTHVVLVYAEHDALDALLQNLPAPQLRKHLQAVAHSHAHTDLQGMGMHGKAWVSMVHGNTRGHMGVHGKAWEGKGEHGHAREDT